jgi:hypothetical protein
MKKSIELIRIERAEQVVKHGRTVEADRKFNTAGQLVNGAMGLLLPDGSVIPEAPTGWNHSIWERMFNKPYRERLILAGALLVAEEERIGTPGAFKSSISEIAERIDNIPVEETLDTVKPTYCKNADQCQTGRVCTFDFHCMD